MADHDETEDNEPTLLESAVAALKKEEGRVRAATAISSVKDALLQRVFPLLEMLAEATQGLDDDLRGELFGDPEDEDDEGLLGDLEERCDGLDSQVEAMEDKFAIATTGLEMRVRLQTLARAVRTYAADRPELVADATDALAFIESLDGAVLSTIAEARAAQAAEAEAESEPNGETPAADVVPEPTQPPAAGPKPAEHKHI